MEPVETTRLSPQIHHHVHIECRTQLTSPTFNLMQRHHLPADRQPVLTKSWRRRDQRRPEPLIAVFARRPDQRPQLVGDDTNHHQAERVDHDGDI